MKHEKVHRIVTRKRHLPFTVLIRKMWLKKITEAESLITWGNKSCPQQCFWSSKERATIVLCLKQTL